MRLLQLMLHILREASACLLVLLRWAIPGPQQAERANGTALTLFLSIIFIIYFRREGEPGDMEHIS